MSVLKNLKLSDAVRLSGAGAAIEKKREKLILNIERQIKNAKAEDNQELYVYEDFRHVTHPETGDRARQRVSVRVRPWYFANMSGNWFTHIKYGNKKLEFAKGKKAIEIGDRKQLAPTLQKIADAVRAGELDELISGVAVFGKQ